MQIKATISQHFDILASMLNTHHKQQISVIHLMRGIAACMVAFYHFSCWGDRKGGFYSENDWVSIIGGHGNMGVYMFFVISGFVITYSLFLNDYKIKDFGRFLFKRSIRIEIPYLVSIALVILVRYIYHLCYNLEFVVTLKQLFLHFFYLIPFTKYSWLSSVYWTLGIEFQFYLIIAFIFPLLISGKDWQKTIVLCLFVCLNLFDLKRPDVWFIYSHSSLFVMGIISAMFMSGKVKLTPFLLVMILSVFISVYVKGVEITLFGLSTAILILIFRFKNVPGRWLGSISYSLYLTHFLIGNNLIFYFVKESHWPVSKHLILAISMVLAIGFAWVFHKLVEYPAQQLSSRIKLKRSGRPV